MGHDIEIIDDCGDCIESAYISGNFSCLDAEFGGIYRIHGHKGLTVSAIIHKTIKLIDAYGTEEPTEQEKNDGNYYWGVCGDPGSPKRLEKRKFLYVFREHMVKFLEIANMYPDYRWMSDQVFSITPCKISGYESDG